MSGRAVRKAVRKREAELELLKASTPNLNSDASESEEEAPAPQKQSLFALLNIPDERDEQDDEEEEEEEEEPAPPPKPVAASKKSKNKKKKSAKAKSKVQKEDQGEEEDDIDKALRQLKVSGPGVTAEVSEPTAGKDEGHLQLSSVLSIDTRSLDAGNEMKKLFGKDALRPEDGEGAGGRRRGAARVQLVPGGATGGRSLNKGRKNTFVQPKDDWPNSGSGGLGMEIEDTDLNGVTTYRFVHSRQYQGVQREFMMCVASMDPNRLIALLQHNPYHITTLLQCSEIFHHQRDFTVAGDLLERALFSLGRSLHSSFQQKLAEGKARLSFRRPENRELFLCGWRYIKNLSQRGTWRTAEEFARLLLAMDPQGDPYEMDLLVDFLALKARQPERLLALTEHPAMRRKYSDLPNIAFSSALAQLQLGNESTAVEYLSKAITKFPWIPNMLYQEINVDANLPPALWGLQPPEDNPRQKILAKLYVERTKDIWKQPQFSTFLVETASNIYKLPRKPLLGESPSVEVSLSLARHIILTDLPAITTLLPREITTRESTSFDPLPPADDERSYKAEAPTTGLPGVLAPGGDVDMSSEDGGFATFLRSILPWFRAGERGEVDGRRLNEDERARLRDLRGQLETAGVDVEGILRAEDEEGRPEDEARE